MNCKIYFEFHVLMNSLLFLMLFLSYQNVIPFTIGKHKRSVHAALQMSISISTSTPIEPLYYNTPLLRSLPMSKLFETDSSSNEVWLKLDCLQPSGSFKDRGMALLTTTLKNRGISRLISSSGGNAGHSVSHAGRLLNLAVTVVVPSTTKPIMLSKIKAQGASVQVYGNNWNEADGQARMLCEGDKEAAYVSPYDDALLWKGHSTIVDELAEANLKPDAVVVSVGGGGLLCGVYEGLLRHGWSDVCVVAAETKGADSFSASFAAGKITRLKSIESIATSLGTLEVTEQALIYSRNQPTMTVVVSDKEAVETCCRFLDDHRLLVEPACGASLAVAYSPDHRQKLSKFKKICFVVCGGGGVTLDILNEWRQKFLV